MADVTSNRESDWGPWQTKMPPVGHPFILQLSPRHVVPPVVDDQSNSNGGRYRITRVTKASFDMERWMDNQWNEGHGWEMTEKPSFRLLIIGALVDRHAGEGCVCTVCNDRNRWAEPNQPNGTYICFACPKPRR